MLLLALLGALACADPLQRRVDSAREQLEGGSVAEAVTMLHELVSEAPQHREANYLLGLSYLQAGRPGLAVGPLAKSSASEEFAGSAGVALASALLDSGDPRGAVAAANRVLEIEPERVAALHTRAQALLSLRQPEQALADSDALLERDPDGVNALRLRAEALAALQRLDEAEAAHLRLRETVARQQPALASRACLGLASFQQQARRAEVAAAATYAECLAAHPTDVLLLTSASDFHRARGDAEAALGPWRRALEQEPESLVFRSGLAGQLAVLGRGAEAEKAILGADGGEPSAQTWLVLASHRRQHGDPEGALDAIDRAEALSSGAEAEELRRLSAELRLEMGDLDGAEAVLATLENETNREVLRGMLLDARGRHGEALAVFGETLARLPADPRLHFLAGRAAKGAGEWERAQRHLATALQIDPRATDAALLLAELQLKAGAFQAAAQLAARHLALRDPASAQGPLLKARAAVAVGRLDEARELLDESERRGADPVAVAVERARLARRGDGGAAAAARVLSESGLDFTSVASEPALRALAGDLAASGRTGEAVRLVERAAAARPEAASFREILARVRLLQGDTEAAQRRFGEALSLDGDYAPALAGLAELSIREGDHAQALALLDRASAGDPAEAAYPYRAAQVLLAQGRSEEAEERLRGALRRAPGHANACNDLAWILAEKGEDLSLALDLARRATQLGSDATYLHTLGWVQLAADQPEAAVIAFRRAVQREPESPSFWYHLGLAQVKTGAEEDARSSLRKALAFEEFAETEEARAVLARLEER